MREAAAQIIRTLTNILERGGAKGPEMTVEEWLRMREGALQLGEAMLEVRQRKGKATR
jgi:hypothetical protein